jgi:5-methylcytosine-specific restriction endonuclease McrA
MRELRTRLPEIGNHEHFDRRLRNLRPYFSVRAVRDGKEFRYILSERQAPAGVGDGLSERERAVCLAPGRCAMCGRTPLDDGVRLQCDHELPREWGGTNDPRNLQPLCEECNRGKKAHFATYDKYADQIRAAIGYESVHVRIGELLKAFGSVSARSDLIGLVASRAESHQEDWQKRLRELRVLGWVIAAVKRREAGRIWSYYVVREWRPWPNGNVRAEIARLERQRGYRRRHDST